MARPKSTSVRCNEMLHMSPIYVLQSLDNEVNTLRLDIIYIP